MSYDFLIFQLAKKREMVLFFLKNISLCMIAILICKNNLDFSYKKSILVCLVKFSIPLFWFMSYSFSTPMLPDSISYYNKSHDLYKSINGLDFSIFSKSILYAASMHFLYYLYLSFIYCLYDVNYYLIIISNVSLTFFSAIFIRKFLIEAGCETKLSQNITLFFLLSPSTISWSSFHVLKEPFLELFLLISFFHAIKFIKNPTLFNILLMIFSSFLCVFIRFYTIIILYCSIIFSLFSSKINTLIKIIITILFSLISIFLYVRFISDLNNVYNSNSSVFLPAIRYLLTPLPWKISYEYTFLTIQSITHIILFPFFLWGIFIYDKNPSFYIMIVFFSLNLLLHSLIPAIQGPRQRYVLNFIFIIFQYYGLRHVIFYAKSKIEKIMI